MIIVDIEDNKKLIINSLNGLIDQVNSRVCDIIYKWQDIEEINPEGELETALYSSLESRGYLVSSFEEEMIEKDKVIRNLREINYKQKQSCKHITFIMTYNCNFRCPYCFEGENVIKKEIIKPEQIDAALELAKDSLETVGLFGGEPLLPANRLSLEYLISKTSDKTFAIITNGYYLLEFFDLLSPLNFSYIMVTLDGSEDTHNSRRYLANGEPTFQKIMLGIEKYLSNGIPIRIRMNIGKGGWEEGNQLKSGLLERFFEFKDLLTFEISSMFGDSAQDRADVTTELYKNDSVYSDEEKRQRNTLTGRFSPIVNVMTVGSKLSPVYSFCNAHSNLFLVDPYGWIYTCLVAVGNENLAVGKYCPKIEFKANSIYNRNIETIPGCRECKYSLLCGGGCPLGLKSYEDVCKPECFSIRNQIYNIMPRIYQINQESAKQKQERERAGVV